MSEYPVYHRAHFDGRDDLELAVTPRVAFNVEIEHVLEQARLPHVRRRTGVLHGELHAPRK